MDEELRAELQEIKIAIDSVVDRVTMIELFGTGHGYDEEDDTEDTEVPEEKFRDRSSFDFGIDGALVTIYEGSVRIPGIGSFDASETDVTLTAGTTEWVYLKCANSGHACTIEHSSTEPESDGVFIRIPLHKFTKTGGVWIHARDCRTDIHLGSPIK